MHIQHHSDNRVSITHERLTFPMEVWTTNNTNKWFWNMVGGPVLGQDDNMLVAIEKAMVALERMALG